MNKGKVFPVAGFQKMIRFVDQTSLAHRGIDL